MFCHAVRPTWSELMGMDYAMSSAVLERLPDLNAGTGNLLKALAAITGRR